MMSQSARRTLRGHVHDELPERLVAGARVHVPKSIVHCTSGNMNDTFFRTDPAQLRITDEELPCLAHILEQLLHILADETLRQRFDRRTDLNEPCFSAHEVFKKQNEGTISFPRPIVKVMPWPTRSGDDVKRVTYADE
jgi:hypothetical protein